MSFAGRLLAVAALIAGAGACSDAGFEPPAPPPDAIPRITTGAATAPNFALGGGPSCDRSSPIQAFGLTHVPAGGAALGLTASGGLRASGIGSSGLDGVCTRLPGAARVRVTLAGNQPGGFGLLGPGEAFRLMLAGPGGWRQTCAVRGAPGGQTNVACYNAAAAGWKVALVRNGQVVRTATVDGPQAVLTVPGFTLTDFEWDLDTGAALKLAGATPGLITQGLQLLPIVQLVALPPGLNAMVTTMEAAFPGREYGYSAIDWVGSDF